MIGVIVRSARRLLEIFGDQAGADLVEYGLVLSLLALGSTAAVGTVAGGVGAAYNDVVSKFAIAGNAVSGGSHSGLQGGGSQTGSAKGSGHHHHAGSGHGRG